MHLTHIINSPHKTLITFFLPNSFDLHHTLHEHMSNRVTQTQLNHLHYAYPVHFSIHHKVALLQNFLHFEDHSTSCSKNKTQLPSFYQSPSLLSPARLLLHHISHTTNSISFSSPPQLISSSLHPHHPGLSISSPANNTYQSSSLSSSQTPAPFPLTLPTFHTHTLNVHQASSHTAS